VTPVETDTETAIAPRDATADRQGAPTGTGNEGRPPATASPDAPAGDAPAGGTAAVPPSTPELAIARLEGRVAALEAALEARSNELRRLQSSLCQRDLAQWTRMATGLLPLPRIAHEPAYWQETLELTGTDVPETLEDLWASLYPASPARTAPR
jgi:hypothetical protein